MIKYNNKKMQACSENNKDIRNYKIVINKPNVYSPITKMFNAKSKQSSLNRNQNKKHNEIFTYIDNFKNENRTDTDYYDEFLKDLHNEFKEQKKNIPCNGLNYNLRLKKSNKSVNVYSDSDQSQSVNDISRKRHSNNPLKLKPFNSPKKIVRDPIKKKERKVDENNKNEIVYSVNYTEGTNDKDNTKESTKELKKRRKIFGCIPLCFV